MPSPHTHLQKGRGTTSSCSTLGRELTTRELKGIGGECNVHLKEAWWSGFPGGCPQLASPPSKNHWERSKASHGKNPKERGDPSIRPFPTHATRCRGSQFPQLGCTRCSNNSREKGAPSKSAPREDTFLTLPS